MRSNCGGGPRAQPDAGLRQEVSPWDGAHSMDSARSEAAAETLATVRREGRLLERLPEESRPRSLAEGYEIQSAFVKSWPDKLAGWKIGATSHVTMERFGVSE